MLFYTYLPSSPATVSGGWSGNTSSVRGLLRQIVVQPTSSGTIFDVRVTDKDDIDILYYEDITGTMNDILVLPVIGTYTVAVENATNDESFNIKLLIQEL